MSKATRYIFFTNQVDRMVRFYRDMLGMTVLQPPEAMEYEPKDWVQLSDGSIDIGIPIRTSWGLD